MADLTAAQRVDLYDLRPAAGNPVGAVHGEFEKRIIRLSRSWD